MASASAGSHWRIISIVEGTSAAAFPLWVSSCRSTSNGNNGANNNTYNPLRARPRLLHSMLMADCMSCHFVCLPAAPWHVFLCPLSLSLSLVIFPPLLLSLFASQISVDHLCNCLSDCAAKQLFTYFLHSSSRTPTWSWSSSWSWSWSCCGNRIALPAVPAAALLIKFCAFRLCLLLCVCVK